MSADLCHFSRLNEFRLDDKYCDTVIQIRDKRFACHRVVLASTSNYFDAMFGGNFKESRLENFTLHNVGYKSFEMILEFIYTGHICTITTKNVYHLFSACEFLGISKVKDSCVQFILENISAIDALRMFEIACAVNHIELIDKLSLQIVTHFSQNLNDEQFLNISFDNLKVLLKRYRSLTFLIKRYENFIFDALVQWVDHSFEVRHNLFEELFQMVDLNRLSLKLLTQKYKNIPQVLEKLDMTSLTKIVTGQVLDVSQEVANHTSMPTQCQNTPTIHLMLKSEDVFRKTVRVLSMNEDVVSPKFYLSCSFIESNFSKEFTSYTSADKSEYVYSLKFADNNERSFQAYSSIDLSSNPRKLSCFPGCYCWGPLDLCAIDKSTIYLLYKSMIKRPHDCIQSERMEFNEEELENGIFSYNCELNKWFAVPKMRKRLMSSYVIGDNVHNMLYLLGGNTDRSYTPLEGSIFYAQAYDPRTSVWQELPEIPHTPGTASILREEYRSACAVNGKIYMCRSDAWMQVFDPVAGRWKVIAIDTDGPVKTERKLISYRNFLWSFYLHSHNLNVETYNPTSHQWCSYKFPFERKDVLENVLCFKHLEP